MDYIELRKKELEEQLIITEANIRKEWNDIQQGLIPLQNISNLVLKIFPDSENPYFNKTNTPKEDEHPLLQLFNPKIMGLSILPLLGIVLNSDRFQEVKEKLRLGTIHILAKIIQLLDAKES